MGGTGRYGSCTRACPLKLEMDQRYGFIFQDVFLPGCQMPFVTPPTLLSIRIWAKRISELKEFLSVRHLAQEAVPAPLGSLGSWRKTPPAHAVWQISSVSQRLPNTDSTLTPFFSQDDFNKSCVRGLSTTKMAVKILQRWQI